MRLRGDSLRIEAICNGYALFGRVESSYSVFLAHLGDGVDGLPDLQDPDLPEIYGFELASVLVQCPECQGSGVIATRARAAMLAGVIPCSGDMRVETCGFCEGTGQVSLKEYRWYEQAIAESCAG